MSALRRPVSSPALSMDARNDPDFARFMDLEPDGKTHGNVPMLLAAVCCFIAMGVIVARLITWATLYGPITWAEVVRLSAAHPLLTGMVLGLLIVGSVWVLLMAAYRRFVARRVFGHLMERI